MRMLLLLRYTKLAHQLIGNLAEGLRLRTFWTGYYCRLARVGIRADLRMKRDVAEERYAHFFAFPPRSCKFSALADMKGGEWRRTIQAEDVVFMAAVGADESAHVLHHA